MVARDLFPGRPSAGGIIEGPRAETDSHERLGHLPALRIDIDHALELGERLAEVALLGVGLAHPPLRLRGERMAREARDQVREPCLSTVSQVRSDGSIHREEKSNFRGLYSRGRSG